MTTTKFDIFVNGVSTAVRLRVPVLTAFKAKASAEKLTYGQAAVLAQREHNGSLAEAIEKWVGGVPLYSTRETWLMAIVEAMRPVFKERGYPLPEKIRATIAFTSKGWRGKTRGECWRAEMSADQTTEIMVCLRESDPVEIVNILTHELCHAAQFLKAKEEGRTVKGGGHGKDFQAIGEAMDMTGDPARPGTEKTKCLRGDPKGAWGAWALPLMEAAGPMPHHAIAEHVAKEKKQTTRMLKFTHEGCSATEDGGEYVWRASAKSVADKPSVWCPCCGERVPNPHYEGADEDGEDGEEMLLPKGHPLREAEEASVKRGKRFVEGRTPAKTVKKVDRTLKAIGKAVTSRVKERENVRARTKGVRLDDLDDWFR